MQRRLFLLFLLLSLVPAITLLAVHWQLSQRHLEFLDSPGLGEALESSLQLARSELQRRQIEVSTALAELRAVPGTGKLPSPPSAGDLLVRMHDGEWAEATGAPDHWLHQAITEYATGAVRPATTRIALPNSSWVAAACEIEGDVWVLVRPLPDDLHHQLAAVSQGGARVRQLRLYYGDLLRGDTLATLGVLGLIVLIVSLLLSRTLARRIADPIGKLAEGTRRVADGDLDYRVEVDAPAEIGQLVDAFNSMTDQLRTNKQDLIQAERVAAWQGVARRLAHEIKNPLTPITLAMHRIGKRSVDAAVTESVQSVLEETENLKRLANEFSQYARLPAPEPEPADLLELAHAVVELYTGDARLQVAWEAMIPSAPVRVDTGQIRQVLANLVKNAVAATGGAGVISLRVDRVRDRMVLWITDTGPGLGKDPEHVFEPYFTTKATGTGLGLPIARKIVEDHRGRLTARNTDRGGAEFQLELPAAEGIQPEETS